MRVGGSPRRFPTRHMSPNSTGSATTAASMLSMETTSHRIAAEKTATDLSRRRTASRSLRGPRASPPPISSAACCSAPRATLSNLSRRPWQARRAPGPRQNGRPTEKPCWRGSDFTPLMRRRRTPAQMCGFGLIRLKGPALTRSCSVARGRSLVNELSTSMAVSIFSQAATSSSCAW